MKDTAKLRTEMTVLLEQVLMLSEQAGEPVVGYLIERALDEIRGANWGLQKPKPQQ